MVKLDDIPEEKPRIDLEYLHNFMDAHGGTVDFIVESEREQAGTEDKTGGINMQLWTGANFVSNYDIDAKSVVTNPITYEDGLRLTQKYSKISGRHLREAMEQMKIKDTEKFQESFYTYRLKAMRQGYGRLIPISQSEKEFESA